MRRILDGLYLGAGIVAGFCLVMIFLIMIGMSAGRLVGLNIPAGDDFTAWFMAAMAFLGLAHTFKSGEMIRVMLLLERLPPRVRWVMEWFALSVAVASIGFFSFHMAKMAYESWQFNDLAQGAVAFPLWVPQSAVAIGLGILLIAIIDEWVHVARGNRPTFEKPPPKTTEELIERVAEGGGI